MTKPTIFISYSRKDAEWKDRLASHFGVAEKQGQLNQWFDTLISAGEDWEPQIEAAMNAASIAVLLVTDNYLNSEYVREKEIPILLRRRATDGLRVIPILIKPCDWEAVGWLKKMNLLPDPKRPISTGNEHQIDSDFATIAKEIRELLKRTAPPTTLTFVPLSPDDISTSRLPRLLTPDLFGRENELELLDKAWANSQTNVISFVAWGGVGKTALVHHWLQALERDQWRGAERVFAWSFYSQGTNDKAATAEYFINAALRWFGGDELADKRQTAGQWEKGERLAQLIRQTRTLLILDGLEPVQHPPLHPDEPEGGLKEQTMQALLRELATHQPGLCVISTRVAIADLTQFEGRSVVRQPLDELSPAAGAQLLRRLKVNGTPEELEAAAREYGGHSLALTLLGSYLGDVYAGDVRRRHEIESLEEDRKHGWQARKMFRAYEKWLGGKDQAAMLNVLRMMGLFNRPADSASLHAAPAIAGLTDALQGLSEREWKQTIAALRDLRLLATASPDDPDTLDAHLLLREHFSELLRRAHPEAWKAGNLRLYEHLTRTAKEFPDTIEEMTPLFAAITHGCAAGRQQQAFDDVYWQRIQRGEQSFNAKKLGALGAELAALSGFFATPWRVPSAALTEADQAFVLNEAGIDLRALGRLREAVKPMQASLDMYIAQAKWEYAT
ncbi:MAG: toll/interleukin-1 receptor domain-containing protein, partial [Acidobacteriota bacterium]|nr:toll/interleukin-1 receptor domain-containing protein [Acidobacteriota bacterium]